MLPGECVGIKEEIVCEDCKAKLPLQVCHSNAGYYIGYWCPNCGPYSRETDYFRSDLIANKELRILLKGVISKSLRERSLMKSWMLLIPFVFLLGCDDTLKTESIDSATVKVSYGSADYFFRIVEIDGCEYFFSGQIHSTLLAHKGNCKNPIHRGLEKSDGKASCIDNMIVDDQITLKSKDGKKLHVTFESDGSITVDSR